MKQAYYGLYAASDTLLPAGPLLVSDFRSNIPYNRKIQVLHE